MKQYRFSLLAGVFFTSSTLLPGLAWGAPDSCAQKAELKAASYPRNDDEWHSRCASGTKTCLESWKTLAVARQQVGDDYHQLCQHLAQAADVSSCDRNCLDNAVVGLRQAVADTEQTYDDAAKLEKAARDGRKQNLLFAATLIDQRRNNQAAAEPRCSGDFRISWRVVSFFWAEPAMAAAKTGATSPKEISGVGAPVGTEPQGDSATPPAPDVVGRPTAARDLPSADTSQQLGKKASQPGKEPTLNPLGGTHSSSGPDPEVAALAAATKGDPLPEPNGSIRPQVLENLVAAVESLKAAKELQRKQTELAQDKQSLTQQLAELEGRRRDLASAPSSPESPAQPFVAASSDAPAQGSAPALPALQPPASSAIALGSAAPTLSDLPRGAREQGRKLAAPFDATNAPSATATPDNSFRNASDVTRTDLLSRTRGRTAQNAGPNGAVAGGRNRAPASAPEAASNSRPTSGSLADLLRRRLGAEDAASAPESEASLKPGSAAEGAIASVLHAGENASGASGESQRASDYSGLTPMGSGESLASEFQPRESPGLFERVHSAHQRFQERSTRRHGRSASL